MLFIFVHNPCTTLVFDMIRNYSTQEPNGINQEQTVVWSPFVTLARDVADYTSTSSIRHTATTLFGSIQGNDRIDVQANPEHNLNRETKCV